MQLYGIETIELALESVFNLLRDILTIGFLLLKMSDLRVLPVREFIDGGTKCTQPGNFSFLHSFFF
jgi:hypothetical protein